MTILSALKETNANNGCLEQPIPGHDDYPTPPNSGYRRIPRHLHRKDAFVIKESKASIPVRRILAHNTFAYTTFIDCNKRRTYVQIVKGLEEGKKE